MDLEKPDKSCQTTLDFDSKKFENPAEKFLIQKEARESAKLEFNKILDEERNQHQIEVKKIKKKQWCTLCLKEGKRFDRI